MSRKGLGTILAAVAGLALALAVPAGARNSNAGNNSKVTATVEILNDASLGGKEVKAGTYQVKADDTKITLLRNGKVVAEAPVQWKEDSAKSHGSQLVIESGNVREIHFNGKTKYAEIAPTSESASGGER